MTGVLIYTNFPQTISRFQNPASNWWAATFQRWRVGVSLSRRNTLMIDGKIALQPVGRRSRFFSKD